MTLLAACGALFLAFFKIGIFGFGGGMAMLPIIGQTMEHFGILNAEEFGDLVAVSQITPGPIAINAATYAGFKYAGVLGSAAATIGVALPALLLMLLAMKLGERYRDTTVVQGTLFGIRPAVVGLIGAAIVVMASGVLYHGTHIEPIPCVICAGVAALMLWKKRLNPVIPMLLMGLLGAFIF